MTDKITDSSIMEWRKDYSEKTLKLHLWQEKSKITETDYNKCCTELCKLLYSNIKHLYRYRSNDKWEEYDKLNFENNEIYAPTLDKMNDPFEFQQNTDFNIIAEKCLPKKTTDIRYVNASILLKDIHDEVVKKICKMKNQCAIACFSEKKDNLLMWAHYANSHHGYCVEHSTIDLFKAENSYLLPILYQTALPKIIFENTINQTDTFLNAAQRLNTKSIDWSYEQEWRIVKIIHDDNHIIKDIVPTAVYLGCEASQKFENEMLTLCAKKRIALYRMKKSTKEYKLIPNLIHDFSME